MENLQKFAVNLCERASQGKLDPVIGRDDEIRRVLSPDYLGVMENLSMIAVVGECGTESSDANAKVLAALARAGLPINTINQGAGKLNLLIGVPEEKYAEAIRAIYYTIEEEPMPEDETEEQRR